MAHFAKLDDNNLVIAVNVVDNSNLDPHDEEASGIRFLTEWSGGYSNWKQTSYNRTFRKNYAGIGYRYDNDLDAFIPPQPFLSWSLDENCTWQPPKPRPDGNFFWNEEELDWVNGETV